MFKNDHDAIKKYFQKLKKKKILRVEDIVIDQLFDYYVTI